MVRNLTYIDLISQDNSTRKHNIYKTDAEARKRNKNRTGVSDGRLDGIGLMEERLDKH
jgi:hypothetical protein